MSDCLYPKLPRIIACDFDGTVTLKSDYPNMGEPDMDTINYLLEEKANGSKLVLWTCRGGEQLEAAIEYCKAYGVEFDAHNEDLPEVKAVFKGAGSRKVYATVYLDDKSEHPRSVRPRIGESKAPMSEGFKDILAHINKTPELMSLLYDLGLLPEQVRLRTTDCNRMMLLSVWHKLKFQEVSGG